jgi:hypothetical protein
MKETQALLERARRYLKSAALLLDDGDYESAVSRAYYAMFYAAEAVLLTETLASSSHKGVLSMFGERFIKTGELPREMGRELHRAFEKRQLSDYEYTFVISQEEAEQVLSSGQQFVAQILEYLSDQEG